MRSHWLWRTRIYFVQPQFWKKLACKSIHSGMHILNCWSMTIIHKIAFLENRFLRKPWRDNTAWLGNWLYSCATKGNLSWEKYWKCLLYFHSPHTSCLAFVLALWLKYLEWLMKNKYTYTSFWFLIAILVPGQWLKKVLLWKWSVGFGARKITSIRKPIVDLKRSHALLARPSSIVPHPGLSN